MFFPASFVPTHSLSIQLVHYLTKQDISTVLIHIYVLPTGEPEKVDRLIMPFTNDKNKSPRTHATFPCPQHVLLTGSTSNAVSVLSRAQILQDQSY